MPDMDVLEQLITEAIENLRGSSTEEERSSALRLMLMVQLQTLETLRRLEEAAEITRQYPSITWLLRYRTRGTLFVLGTIVTIILALAGMGLWQVVAQILGVPIS